MRKRVFVISKDGTPLMPCSPTKARHLLKEGEAKIVRRELFAIQLTVSTTNHTQKSTLGIDPGFSHIGFSVITDKKELVSGTLEHEKHKTSNPTSDRLKDKKMYRRMRRSRLRHRQPRWLNRAAAKKDGWLPPSINRKKDTHLNLINKLRKYVPIDRIVFEKNKFDIAKLNNPDIDGTDYQQGKLFETNRKNFLYHEQSGVCPICKKRLSEETTHIHHIKPRRVGGSDTIDNLVLLHDSCHVTLDHVKWHEYEKLFKKQGFKSKHKADTCMNMLCKKLVEELNPEVTYGYVTQVNRIGKHLSKEHYNDAFVIAGGDKQERCEPLLVTQRRVNNRVLQWNNLQKHPGYRIRRSRNRFQSGDIVYIEKKKFICGGTQGGRIVIGSKKSKGGYRQAITVSPKKVTKHIFSGSLTFAKTGGLPLIKMNNNNNITAFSGQ